MSAILTPIKFTDPAYRGGALSDGFITSDGVLIEPGNTNGYAVDPFGWYLAQFQAGTLVMDATLAGKLRGECAATGITPPSFWEYIGKPLVIMATAVAGGAAIAASSAAAAGTGAVSATGATLAPTVIAAPAAVTAAAPISIAGVATVAAPSLATIGAVGGVSAGTGVLADVGGVLASAQKTVGLVTKAGAVIGALTASPAAPEPIALGPAVVTHKPFPWLWVLGAIGAGAALLFSGAL